MENLKDPRDVTSNGFNRFDPKYISIGPKAIRNTATLNTAVSVANKCATLRYGGKYGGSLSAGIRNSPNPNLKNTPNIAKLPNEHLSSISQHKTLNLPPKREPLPGIIKNDNECVNKIPQQQQQHQQSSVYSIDTVCATFQPRQSEHRSINTLPKGVSIINQPLPKPPVQNISNENSKNIQQQPLSVSNLNQYRSLQRPSSKSAQMSSTSYQMQQNFNQNIQMKDISKQSIVVPPTLPPKNRHRDDSNKNRNYSGTLPSKSSQGSNQYLNNQYQKQLNYTTFGYEKDDNTQFRSMSTFEKPPPPPPQQHIPIKNTNLTNDNMMHIEHHKSKTLNYNKQNYQKNSHQRSSNSHSNSGHSNTMSHSNGKSGSRSSSQRQNDNRGDNNNPYYHSLQRNNAQGNDLYSVTEL